MDWAHVGEFMARITTLPKAPTSITRTSTGLSSPVKAPVTPAPIVTAPVKAPTISSPMSNIVAGGSVSGQGGTLTKTPLNYSAPVVSNSNSNAKVVSGSGAGIRGRGNGASASSGATSQNQVNAGPGSPTATGQSGFTYYSQPYSGQNYGASNSSQPFSFGTNQPTNVSPVAVAQSRTQIPVEQAPTISSIVNGLGALPTIQNSAQNYSLDAGQYTENPTAQMALSKKMNLSPDDFGMTQDTLEKMKVAEAKQINQGYDAQREAAKRMLSKAGILNDSAMTGAEMQLDQGRRGQIYNSYNNIDVQNALKANEQRLSNLNEIMNAGLDLNKTGESAREFNANMGQDVNKLNENSRQFNVSGLLDESRLKTDTQKWAEDARMQRSKLQEAIAQYLEDYDLQRLKMKQGLVADDPKLMAARADALSPVFSAPVSYPSFATGG